MASSNTITAITEAQREELIAKTSKALPDNPSDEGWTSTQIKEQLGYLSSLFLLEIVEDFKSEARSGFANIKTDILAREAANTALLEGTAVAKRAEQDNEGIGLIANYAKKAYADALAKSIRDDLISGDQSVFKYVSSSGEKISIETIATNLANLIANLTTGVLVSKKAEEDSNGNKFEDTYALISSLTGVDFRLRNIEDGTTSAGKAILDTNGKKIVDEYLHVSSVTSDKTSDGSLVPKLSVVKELVSDGVASIINSSPAALDTLKELADALGNDPNFATTIAADIGMKLSKSEAAITYLTIAAAASGYDVKGAASAVQGNTTKTVKEVLDQEESHDSACVKTVNGMAPTSGNINMGGYFSMNYDSIKRVLHVAFSTGSVTFNRSTGILHFE